MGFQWSMVDEAVEDVDRIVRWLERDFEPFAVAGRRVFLKQRIYIETDPRASEGTPSEEVLDADSGGTGRVGQDEAGEADS